MFTSGQISQMIAQQNQAFAGSAMYSQQISQSMPGMYSGMFGMPMSGGGGFAYSGQAPLGYDIGSRASGGMMSAMGGMAHMALGAGTLMAGLGMGGPMRYALDPFAGAGAMYRAGSAMGMGMGGRLAMGAAGMLPAAGLVAGAGHVIGSVMSGAQEQSAIERTLGSNFSFMNPQSGGRGFSRSQSMAIGDMVRQIEHVPDMMTSMGELTKIMDKVSQMGMMNGITNVRDFGTKFKQTLGTLKDLSKIMSSSMEEAIPILQNLRQSGMYTGADIKQGAMQGQIVGGLTGMNQVQIAQVRSMGAQMGFATGGYRKTGAQHAMRVAGQLGMANQMGIISNDQIAEMTGLEGAEGIQALSGEITQAGYKMSQSALGTAMSIAMAEQSGGRFTGKMDAELMDRFRRGDISKSEMLRMVHQKTGSRGAKMSYVRQKNRLRSEMAGSMGVEGQMSMLKMVLGERGYDNPDALNIVSQGFGLDEREAELLVDLGQKMPDINLEMKQRGRSEAKRIAQQAFMKQNYSWDSIKHKVGKKIEGVITDPFKKFGADLRDSINSTVDDFVDDITGRYKVEVTQGMSTLMKSAGLNLGDSRKRLASLIGGKGGTQFGNVLRSGVDMTPGSVGAAANWLTGNQTAGERMVEAMQSTYVGRENLRGVSSSYDQRDLQKMGYNTLDRTHNIFSNNDYKMATDAGMLETSQHLRRLAEGSIMTEGSGLERMEMQHMMGSSDMAGARQALAYRAAFGRDMPSSALSRLTKQYGESDVIGGAMTQKGGFVGLIDRQKLAERANLLSMTPDKAAALAGDIKAFETKGARRIFGAQGGQEFIEIAKSLHGTVGGDFAFNAYLNRDFKQGMNKDLDNYITRGGNFVGTRDPNKRLAMNIRGAIEAGEVNTQGSRSGDFDLTQYYQELAAREQAVGYKHLSAGARASIEANKDQYEAIKDQMKIAQVSQKAQAGGVISWSGDEKDTLRKMGFDNPADFTPEKAKAFSDLNNLMNKASPGSRDEIRKYLGGMQDQSLVEMSQRLVKGGVDIATRASSLRKSGVSLGKSGDTLLGRVEQLGVKMRGATSREGFLEAAGAGKGTSYAQDIGAIAYDLISDKSIDEKTSRRIAAAGGAELEDAYEKARSVKQRLGTNRKLESFFNIDAMLKEGGGQQIADIKKALKVDKSGNIGVSDKEAIQLISGYEGQKGITMAGGEQRSKFASQADIAKNMESFGQSVTTLAQIVSQMKDGKQTEDKK